MNGSPLISTRALGMRSVIGRRRVARPPARIATGSINSSRLGHDGSALKIEPDPHFAQTGGTQGAAETRFVFGIEHQETTASGADQLAAQCAMTQREFIVLVDCRVAHSG